MDREGHDAGGLTMETQRPFREVSVLATLVAGVLVGCLSALGRVSGLADRWLDLLRFGVVSGLLLIGLSIALGAGLDRMHRLGADRSGGERYERLKHQTRVRASSLLLRVLAALCLVWVATVGLSRLDILHLPFDDAGARRAAYALVAFLLGTIGYGYWNSLRFSRPPRVGIATLLLVLMLVAAMALALTAALLTFHRGLALGALVGLAEKDIALLACASAAFLAFALAQSRGLPTLGDIIGSDRALQGQAAINRNRAVILPVLTAFGLLMLAFLLFILFGVGVAGVFTQVARDPIILGLVVLIAAALIISLGAAVGLARSEPIDVPLFKAKKDARKVTQERILAASVAGAALLMVPALLLWSGTGFLGLPSKAWIHFFCIGAMVGLGPYGFYMAREHRRIRLLEERFPDFLRDLASSHKGGLTLANSVTIAARGDYGPLTPEVVKMADQVSWNIAFTEALEQFADRVNTPLVRRASSLILQADKSGGSTTDVLLAAARDAREIKSLENERKLSMSLYTAVIYITFFVFLGVAAVMYSQFVPQLVASSQAAKEQVDALGIDAIGGIGAEALRLEDFQLFYFTAAIMQGVGDGIVAGLMGSGKAVLGLRHSFLMVFVSYITFTVFLA